MPQTLLRTKGLTKEYGKFTALSDVSMTVRQGDIYGLVGRNGAGKTTLLKCLTGLVKPSSGEIEFQGANRYPLPGGVGFMISPAFFPYLNPKQNLEYLCRVKGVPDEGEPDRLLKTVGLSGVRKPFRTFSVGMKQRLGIAAALIGSPPVVAPDEPVSGLDPEGIAAIRDVIRKKNRENGTTFIISSHVLGELDLVATTYGFIEKGRLLQEILHTDLHGLTRESLVIEVDDPARAADILREKLNITDVRADGRRLTLETLAVRSGVVNRILVEAGVEVFRVSPQEGTLEEYFMRLIGGGGVD